MRTTLALSCLALCLTAGAAGAQDVIVTGERSAAPAAATPGPLTTPADTEAGRWARGIMDRAKSGEPTKAALACPPAGKEVQGSVRGAIGTDGYRQTGVTMVKSLDNCGLVGVSIDLTNQGRRGGRGR